MDKKAQIQKAESFLALHHDPKLLVLPNVWDPVGARLLAHLGYPAVATASASVAFSLGYDDGQKISFAAMLAAIGRIAAAVDLPITADVEAGYADSPEAVADNMRQVLQAGAVGINLEDSNLEAGQLYPVDYQCDRIQAVREMANREGIPLVINARTDVFIRGGGDSPAEQMTEGIARMKAYLKAGANCIYPILLGDLEALKEIWAATQAPINVYAPQTDASMHELESAGISRLSLGPAMMQASLLTMKNIAESLQNYGSNELYTQNVMPSSEIKEHLVISGKMSADV